MIGSGVSANSVSSDGKRPPTWGEFLRVAKERMPQNKQYISSALKRYAYLEACAYLRDELGQQAWGDLIREYFVHTNYEPATIHEYIFELDLRTIISLNFDSIYEKYVYAKTQETLVIKNYFDGEIRQTIAGKDRYVIKAHGTADTVSKLIFTLEDYGSARVKHASFYELMTALLHTHVFLFVGCGTSDPDLQILFEDYRYKLEEAPHYMTVPKPFNAASAKLLERTRGLNTLSYSPRDHHSELTVALGELKQLVIEERTALAVSQNW